MREKQPTKVTDAPPPKHAKLENRTAAVQFLIDSIPPNKPTEEQHMYDFDSYLACSHWQHDDILLWWHKHICNFKDTAAVARLYLTIPSNICSVRAAVFNFRPHCRQDENSPTI